MSFAASLRRLLCARCTSKALRHPWRRYQSTLAAFTPRSTSATPTPAPNCCPPDEPLSDQTAEDLDLPPESKLAKTGLINTLSPEKLDYLVWQSPYAPPTPEQLAYADRYFLRKTAEFLFSCRHFREFPVSDMPEIAFVGRSNVGKSSLLNALAGVKKQKLLARTSKKAGRTTTMNAYGVTGLGAGIQQIKDQANGQFSRYVGPGGLILIDCPGYGHKSRGEWGEEILKYMERRKQLRKVYVLLDATTGAKPSDIDLMQGFAQIGVPHQIVLVKADQIIWNGNKSLPSLSRRQHYFKQLKAAMIKVSRQATPLYQKWSTASPELIAVSAKKGERGIKHTVGMQALRWSILQAAGLDCDAQGRPRNIEELQDHLVGLNGCTVRRDWSPPTKPATAPKAGRSKASRTR